MPLYQYSELIKDIPKEIGQIIMRFGGDYRKKLEAMTVMNSSALIIKPDMLGKSPIASNHIPKGWQNSLIMGLYEISQEKNSEGHTVLTQRNIDTPVTT